MPHLSGHTIRTKYIIQTQREQGLDPVVVTSPFYPGNAASQKDTSINGTPYYRIPHPVDMKGPLTLANRVCRWAYKLRQGIYRPSRITWRGLRVLEKHVRRTAGRIERLTGRALRLAIEKLRGSATEVEEPGSEDSRSARRGIARFVLRAARRMYRLARGIASRALSLPATVVRQSYRCLVYPLQRIEHGVLLRRFEEELTTIAQLVKPDILHAHTPYRSGLPALRVSRRLGIPLVYEVRGLWEESAVASGRFRAGGPSYRAWRRKETEVMTGADAVVCICEQLRQEVRSRGAPEERLFLVPNAVDTGVFHPPSPGELEELERSIPEAAQIRERLRGHTLGYLGSIRRLEGVDELVRATARMVRHGVDVSLLVVGDGSSLARLKRLAEEKAIADRTVFTGRVPHDHVPFYYSLIDIFVISRPALRVTKLVTPLKPLEAMAMGRTVVVSDLPALREIVRDGETGLVYRPVKGKDKGRKLATKCMGLCQDDALRLRLAQNSMEWVRKERTWSAVLQGALRAYRSVSPAARELTGHQR